jgi:hypothetical protein
VEPVYLTEVATPATPPAGRLAVYAKSDHYLYYKNQEGKEVFLGPAGAAPQAFPVSSVFISVVNTNPATLLGYGTWAAFGTGRMMVGVDPNDTDFNTAEQTGGAKTHVQTVAEIATHTPVLNSHNHTQDPHNHTQDPHSHTQDVGTVLRNGSGIFALGSGGTAAQGTTVAATATNQAATATNQAATVTAQPIGSSSPMDIKNPYIVVYMWKRTA